MAATTPPSGVTTQLVSTSTGVLPDLGLAAIPSLDAGIGLQGSSSSPLSFEQYSISPDGPLSTISTVTRRLATAALSQALITPGLKPQYSGSGNLLTTTCTQAEYTLLDSGSTSYYVPFVGCINQRPDCCPFSPEPTASGVLPQPLNKQDALLQHCPSDYHSVSGGGCCPSGYTPWTAPLGGQTPCFSSISAGRTPDATAAYPGRATTTGKPTVVISDAVFAMQFSTEEQSHGALSGTAIANIVIGVVGGLMLWVGLAWFLIRRHRARHARSIDDLKSETGSGSSYQATLPHALQGEDAVTSKSAEHRRETSEMNNFCRRSLGPAGFGVGGTPPPSYQEPLTTDQRLRDEYSLQLARHEVSRPTWPGDDEVGHDMPQKPKPTRPLGGDHDHDDLDEGLAIESGAGSPTQEEESPGLLEIEEVQLARPQRLSRGYAKIVYNHQGGSGSSVHTDGKSIRSNLTANNGSTNSIHRMYVFYVGQAGISGYVGLTSEERSCMHMIICEARGGMSTSVPLKFISVQIFASSLTSAPRAASASFPLIGGIKLVCLYLPFIQFSRKNKSNMPRPLPRRLSSSLPPPPRRAYTPDYEESEADDYFQERGRRSSHPGPSHNYDTESRRRRAESANHGKYRPSSRDSYHRPRSTTGPRYRDEEDNDHQRRGRSQRRDSHRPSKSLDGRGRSTRRQYSSSPSSSSSPASSRSSSTDSSLSSHHYGAGRHRRRSSTVNPKDSKKANNRYYPPSASRSTKPPPPPSQNQNKRSPLNRLRSLSLPAVASKLRSRSRSSSSSRSRSRSHSRGRSRTQSNKPPEKRSPSQILLRAAQTFAEAGAIAALKLRDDPSPWIGPNGKAPKVAAAAFSAAAVDTFIEYKHPKRKGGIRHTVMRQVTQMAIGNLVKKADVVENMVPPVVVKGGKGGHAGKAGGKVGGKGGGHRAGGGRVGGGRVHTGKGRR
ncbi:hypothetical protein V8F20_003539 [Naviculisporaceae sp. PSN 640]